MLNERGVREQLNEVRSAIAKLEDERTALHDIETSLLRWLDLHSPIPETQMPLTPPEPPVTTVGPKPIKRSFKPLGSITIGEAVIRTLRNRAGTAMRTPDILETAKTMGVKTNANDPVRVIEFAIDDIIKKNKAPIKKTAPHTFVYLPQALPLQSQITREVQART